MHLSFTGEEFRLGMLIPVFLANRFLGVETRFSVYFEIFLQSLFWHILAWNIFSTVLV